MANPSSEHSYWRVLNLATIDTNRVRISQNRNVWWFLIWRYSANSQIRQIKNLAKFSCYTVVSLLLGDISSSSQAKGMATSYYNNVARLIVRHDGFWSIIHHCYVYRNPEATLRPPFCGIVIELQQPDFKILKWSDKDKSIYSEKAMTLGSPIKEGASLFKDLQCTYLEKPEI